MPLKLRLSETEWISFTSIIFHFGESSISIVSTLVLRKQKTSFICCYGILFLLEDDKANVPPDKKATVFFPTVSIPKGLGFFTTRFRWFKDFLLSKRL